MTRWIPLLLAVLASPAVGQDDRQTLKSKTEEHKGDVTRLRGLEFKRPVTVGVYGKDELIAFLKGEFEKELPRDKAERYQRGYAKFGLIPWDLDVYEAYLELFSSSVAGFYHPKTKELRLIRSGDGGAEEELAKKAGFDMERITMVHELAHAAQDQNFELSTLPLEDETNDDLILALKSVIEGDASAVGWKWQFKDTFTAVIGTINAQYKGGMLPGKAGTLPAYLRMSLTFPYGHGTDFVVKYLKAVSDPADPSSATNLKAATKLFEDLPLSSEQILHPERYHEKRDHPTLITLPDLGKLAGAPWKATFHNVHGEFSIRLILREYRDDRLRLPVLERAAAGWDGDRYVVLEGGMEKLERKNVCLRCAHAQDEAGTCPRCNGALAFKETWERPRVGYAWMSTWDSPKEAREFFDAYSMALCKKYGKEWTEDPDRSVMTFGTPTGPVHLELRGVDVLAIDGGPEGLPKKSGAIFDGMKKSEMTKVERVPKFVCVPCGTKAAFSGACPKCGKALEFKDEEPARKKRDYSVSDR
jgi:hypothetical protein